MVIDETVNGTIDGDGGGFDIVIGNPPYVEAKKLKHIASKLKPLYSLYSGTADLSIYFFEIASKLLRPSGVICYISTNKFFNTLYGKSLRRLLRNMNIKLLINFEQVEVFKKVLVSSVIISFQKEAPAYNNKFIFEHFYKLSADEFKREFIGRIGQFGSYQQDYLDDDEWSFSDLDSIILKDKIRRTGTMIKDTAGISVFRGVTTGYNPAFIIGGATKDMLIGADANNSSIIKNLLQGRNIRKWYYNESDESLIFTRKGILIDRYPTIKKYLSAFYLDLRPRTNNGTESSGRKPGTYQWYEILDNTAYYRHFEQPEKIIWGLTADKWAFTIDSDGHYLPSNGYILTSTTIHIKYILGLLNSKLLHYYFTFIGVMTAGGAYTLKAATIESLPLALGSQIQQDEIVQYVSEILLLKYNNHDYDVTEIEDKIDNIVYDIYGLTKTEKEMLEQHLRK